MPHVIIGVRWVQSLTLHAANGKSHEFMPSCSVLNLPTITPNVAQSFAKQGSIGDFDLAYAYEALARANAVAGTDYQAYLQLAREAGENIVEADDKALFLSDLATLSQ